MSEELSIRAEILEKGGRKLWTRFMDELREKHLGTKPRRPSGRKGVSVRAELRAAYEGVMAKRAKATGPGGRAQRLAARRLRALVRAATWEAQRPDFRRFHRPFPAQ